MWGFIILGIIVIVALTIDALIRHEFEFEDFIFVSIIFLTIAAGIGFVASIITSTILTPAYRIESTHTPISIEATTEGEPIYFYETVDEYIFITQENNFTYKHPIPKSKITHIVSDERKVEVLKAEYATELQDFFFINWFDSRKYVVYCPAGEIEIAIEDIPIKSITS